MTFLEGAGNCSSEKYGAFESQPFWRLVFSLAPHASGMKTELSKEADKDKACHTQGARCARYFFRK